MAAGVLVGGDHRFVVEVALPAVELEEGDLRPCPAAVGGARDGHLGAVDGDAVPSAEEDHDVRVEEVVGTVEGEAGVRAEVDSVCADGRRKRQVRSSPGLPAVAGEIGAHGQPEDLVGARSELLRVPGVDDDEGLALRPALVRDVHVRGRRTAGRRRPERVGSLVGENLELVPPSRIVAVIGGERRKGGGQRSDQGAHMHECLRELAHTPFLLRLLLASPSVAQRASTRLGSDGAAESDGKWVHDSRVFV